MRHARPPGSTVRARGAAEVVRGFPWGPALAACLLAGALSGCGFHLAGSETLPAVLARPYLSEKDPYTDFSRELEHRLTASGAILEPIRAKSTATIEVTKDVVEQSTLSVSSRNIPTDYLLTYTVTFAVVGADAQLLKPQTITVSKDYSFLAQDLLAKEHEADILRQQMARDLVAIAMRRLTRLK